MGLIARKTETMDYEPIPEGLSHGICYALYDLGTQYNEKFGKSAQKVLVCWELPEHRIDIEKEEGKVNLPRAISKMYTLSLHEKSNLRKDLESWRGRAFTPEELDGFNLTKLLGVNAYLNITSKTKDDRVYSNVVSVVPLVKGMQPKTPENETRYFSFDEHDRIPENTPDWIADIIRASEEWQLQSTEYPPDEAPPYDDGEIPF